MKIYLNGATGDVTGSAYHVKTKHSIVLVDCGLYQGGKRASDVIEVGGGTHVRRAPRS